MARVNSSSGGEDEAPATQESAERALAQGQVADKWYLVLHNGVAGYWQGQTISSLHLRGHNVRRLLALGAIAEVGSRAAIQAQESGVMATATPEGIDVQEDVPPPKDEPFIAQPSAPTAEPEQYQIPESSVVSEPPPES